MTIIDDFSVANHESTELTMEQRDGEADTRFHNPTCSQSISGNTSNYCLVVVSYHPYLYLVLHCDNFVYSKHF